MPTAEEIIQQAGATPMGGSAQAETSSAPDRALVVDRQAGEYGARVDVKTAGGWQRIAGKDASSARSRAQLGRIWRSNQNRLTNDCPAFLASALARSSISTCQFLNDPEGITSQSI